MRTIDRLRVPLALAMLFTVVVSIGTTQPASAGFSGPDFDKIFEPATIGPGSVSTLTFTIDNEDIDPVTGLAFTDTLPAGVTIATPSSAFTTCGGTGGIDPTLTAPDGGAEIVLGGASVGGSSSCVVTVNVTSATAGVHMNISTPLTSSAGTGTFADADLTVVTTLPGFSKSFATSPVEIGGRSTLMFTIDNTANASAVLNLDFTDTLPPGMVVVDPANATTDCGTATLPPTLTATAGTSTITLDANGTAGFPAVAAGDTCTVDVDVIGGSVGSLVNEDVELLADFVSAGKATAALEVTGVTDLLELSKEFIDDPVSPGGTTTLEFTVTNKSRDDSATAITFTDDLGAALAGLSAAVPGTPDPPCGAGSTLAFASGVLTLTGGTLPPEGSCTFTVDVTVLATSDPGTYTNTTSTVSGDVGGSPETGNTASDLLFVVSFPVLTKEFTVDPVAAGGTTTIEFTITNPEADSTMSDITFVDELTDGSSAIPPDTTSGFLPFPVSVTLPPVPDPPCGAGSSVALISVGTDRQGLELTGGSLELAGDAGGDDSCTFTVDVDIPDDFAPGTYTNTTETVSAVLDDLAGTPTAVGPAASDDVVVVAAPQLTKEFTNNPVVPGGTSTLTFTLSNFDEDNAASAIAFSDDFAAAPMPGLTVTSVDSDTCGGTPTGVGTTLFGYTGGSLAAAAAAGTPTTCTITLSLTVPTAIGGNFLNTTSTVTATVATLAAESRAAEDTLVVSGLLFTKEFVDNPVIPGDTTTLNFSFENIASDATDILFTDTLSAILPGTPDVTVVTTLPFAACGGTVSGSSTFLLFTAGAVDAASSCAFDVDVLVPAGIADDDYRNVTSGVSYTADATPITGPAAVDDLEINSTLIELTKEFTDDPVEPGSTVTLEFTLTNLSATETVDAIAFSDDLGATLTGLEATAPSLANDCGGMATLPATDFSYSGGSLLPSGSCTIRLAVSVPDAPLPGSEFPNTTSSVTGTVGSLDVVGDPATDVLEIETVNFSKSFDGPTTATGTAVLTFTIDNLDSVNTLGALAFSDDLDAVLSGLAVDSVSPTPPCGAGSTASGTGFLTLIGGSVAPGGSCSFDVTVSVPGTATAGTFPNTTSELFSGGLPVHDPATADLVIEPPPTFAKVFAPDTIVESTVSTLTFTIDNSASTVAASSLDFTDNLPAGVEVATPSGAATDCTGGTLTAASGATTITYTGGTVGAGATCTVDVDVTAPAGAAGAKDNLTGDLTSTSGNSGTAADTLTVTPLIPPDFAKAFDPSTIVESTSSTLTFTIDNTASTVAASSLDFTDNLPAGVEVATPSGAATDCTGGTLTAASGATTITYTGGEVAPGATCTITVDITGATVGTKDNLTGDLTSTSGNSGTAADTLTVTPIEPAFTKEFDPDTIIEGQDSTLTFTIDNTASTATAADLDFTDNLPTGVEIATPSNKAKTCTGGMVDAADGATTISYTGGEVAPGATCTITVDITGATVGTKDNLTGDLTSTSGNSGTAADTLTVTPIEPAFTKEFDPDTIIEGQDSTLTFTIDNTASTATAADLDFTDNLPTGVEIATPSNKAKTCTGGMVDAADGATTISYTGGEVAPGATCTITVDITGATVGTKDNLTGDLTSTSGNSGTAADTLTVTPIEPAFTKEFDPDTIDAGDVTTLTFTIDNTASTATAADLDFTDNLPTGVEIATPSNKAKTCTGGMVDAADGATTISYTGGEVAPGATCTITVDITAAGDGLYINLTGDLTSTSGNSGPAADTLTVNSTTAFTAVTGTRFADTRSPGGTTFDGLFEADGARAAGSTYEVTIADRGPIPDDAMGAIFNLTAVGPSAPGFLTTFPCGTVPTASALNYTTGVDVANEIFAKLSPVGSICVFTSAETDFLIDVVGYVVADDTVELDVPKRVAESRAGATTIDGLMEGFGRTTAGSTTTVQIAGRAGVPLDAGAAIVNVAAIDPVDDSFITVYPCSTPMPTTSSLNYTAGVNRANELVAELSAAGETCIYTDTGIDLIVDVVGYVDAPSDLVNLGPARFADSRGGPTVDGLNSGGGPLAPGSTTEIQITGRDGVPADAISVIANVAAVDPLAAGFFTVTGCAVPTPNASSLNYTTGINGANELVVGLSPTGALCVFTSATTDAIVDVVGYVMPA